MLANPGEDCYLGIEYSGEIIYPGFSVTILNNTVRNI
ncbi:hypothetical protein DYBT9275_00362 [Dyadobacter sp. CECT 9275]|uniref:Uncharacterized protein n=1 Tax=Dyadobacter helix TaxID=2822344 RepID=A0A916J7A6_9BACT|nr:hypothetical protein DYBT9275_00362 [Dyadobacter sp. CECT 9275]